jgi:hypothetical protein
MAKATLNYNVLTEDNLTESFWLKVEKTDTCWFWRGRLDDGYGRAPLVKGSPALYGVHRAMFAIFNESTKPGLVVDHICKQRACCNPDHLRQITISENTKGHIPGAFKEICPNGHFLSGDDAEVYYSMRKPRHGDVEVMHLVCSLCNYPQVA